MPELQEIESIQLEGFLDASPLPGACFVLRFPMWAKNEYVVIFGPADQSGKLQITGASLLAALQEVGKTGLMDYAGLAAWTGSIDVRIINRRDIEGARRGAAVWGELPWPEGYLQSLERLFAILEARPGRTLSTKASVEPLGSAELFAPDQTA